MLREVTAHHIDYEKADHVNGAEEYRAKRLRVAYRKRRDHQSE